VNDVSSSTPMQSTITIVLNKDEKSRQQNVSNECLLHVYIVLNYSNILVVLLKFTAPIFFYSFQMANRFKHFLSCTYHLRL
jgi:hypothetical protein